MPAPGEPRGRVRISVPQVVASQELPHWLPSFLQRYPQVALDLSADDQLVDVVGGGFDLALRIAASLPDSQLVARGAGQLPAHPGRRTGLPGASWPAASGPCAARAAGVQSCSGDVALAAAGPRGASASIEAGQRLRVDATPALYAAALAGMGISLFTALTVQEDLRAGRLIRVLPAWHAGQQRYFALYPHARALAPKVRALVEHLRTTLHRWARLASRNAAMRNKKGAQKAPFVVMALSGSALLDLRQQSAGTPHIARPGSPSGRMRHTTPYTSARAGRHRSR